ncbi:hypothetical protein Dxin01_00169 [Deinococcus xinjiangensis]|uniref:Uncharacterized protein n=1 Tax=Deinococcus xinjiangensis TaxID=457454 RepID=A0ABP9V8Y1_9DEIO
MSYFGGGGPKAALTVAESLHGNITENVRLGDGLTRPHIVQVRLNNNVLLDGVIYAGKVPNSGAAGLVGLSKVITKAGGRWIILA